jgi:catechol 2,3-dioxygenase-like lactoylglutathione lyase family enzyme
MADTLDRPLANVLTLGVRDLERQRAFYRGLGWATVLDSDGFVVFELRGALLALFPIELLARDANAPAAPPVPGIRSSVIITVDSAAEVDALAERARAAGATFTKPPTEAEFFDGRDAYFADPEGNFWEIAWVSGQNDVVAAARRAAGERG